MLVMVRNDVDIKELVTRTHLPLSILADLSGYSVSHIYLLENDRAGTAKMKEEIASILLQYNDEGLIIVVRMWRDRALRAEEKLALFKSAMRGWIEYF